MTSTWRQIIDLQNMEACEALSSSHSVDFLNSLVKTGRDHAPNLLPNSCPVKAERYFTNVTIYSQGPNPNVNKDNEEDVFRLFLAPQGFPNGQYRVVVRLHNFRDPIGFSFWAVIDHYTRYNNETF